jgi:hypothetical protein
MAEAQRITVQRIRLELTEIEASTLLTACERIGGSPTNSRRQYMDGIGEALREAGVALDIPWDSKLVEGNVTFNC